MRILKAKNAFPGRVIKDLEEKQASLEEERRRGVEEAQGVTKIKASIIKEILEQTKPKAN